MRKIIGITQTVVCGVGLVTSGIKEMLDASGNESCNVLVRTEDSNIIRLQFWGTSRQSLIGIMETDNPKGVRVEFRGVLRGVYDEKPTISTGIKNIRLIVDKD